MLHKCGVRVYRRVEEVVSSSSHLQWHHFDAGVVKVLAELAKLSEEDVFEELVRTACISRMRSWLPVCWIHLSRFLCCFRCDFTSNTGRSNVRLSAGLPLPPSPVHLS